MSENAGITPRLRFNALTVKTVTPIVNRALTHGTPLTLETFTDIDAITDEVARQYALPIPVPESQQLRLDATAGGVKLIVEIAARQVQKLCFAAMQVTPAAASKDQVLLRSAALGTHYAMVNERDFDMPRIVNQENKMLVDLLTEEPKHFEFLPERNKVFYSEQGMKFLAGVGFGDGCPALPQLLDHTIEGMRSDHRPRLFLALWEVAAQDFIDNGYVVRPDPVELPEA